MSSTPVPSTVFGPSHSVSNAAPEQIFYGAVKGWIELRKNLCIALHCLACLSFDRLQ